MDFMKIAVKVRMSLTCNSKEIFGKIVDTFKIDSTL
jgi:hypothetical protein